MKITTVLFSEQTSHNSSSIGSIGSTGSSFPFIWSATHAIRAYALFQRCTPTFVLHTFLLRGYSITSTSFPFRTYSTLWKYFTYSSYPTPFST